MLPRLEASERLREISIAHVTNDRGVEDADAKEFREELALTANGGVRSRRDVSKITLGQATSVFNMKPPDEETLKRIAEAREKSGRG